MYQVIEKGGPHASVLDHSPGVSIRRGADRHQTKIGWLHGRHSFDTGIDPLGADTHHGVLVVSNHDTIAEPSEVLIWEMHASLGQHR